MNETMAYLAERVRALIGDHPAVTEKMMFGGPTFLLNGRILVGCRQEGEILLSVGREFYDEALARPGATAMSQRGRTMTGFIWIEPDAIEDDDDLRDWVDFALRAVSTKPPKPDKPRLPRVPRARKTPATR